MGSRMTLFLTSFHVILLKFKNLLPYRSAFSEIERDGVEPSFTYPVARCPFQSGKMRFYMAAAT